MWPIAVNLSDHTRLRKENTIALEGPAMSDNKDKRPHVTRHMLLEVGTAAAALSFVGGAELAHGAGLVDAEPLADMLVRFAEADSFDLIQTFREVETGNGAEAPHYDRNSPQR